MVAVTVPADHDPLTFVWARLAPEVSLPAAAFSSAIYERATLPLREFEAARMAVARANDCAICLTWRSGRDVPSRGADAGTVPEDFYAHVVADPDWAGFSERERLAAEFAHRFATDHRGIDAGLWDRLHARFSDAELVELGLCVAGWLAFGRFNRVFGLDDACRAPGA